MNAAANIAFRAARWPIHTLALLSALIFGVYVFAVEFNPAALPGSLSRSFLVESPTEWSPLAPNELPTSVPKFVGFPVIFPSGDAEAVKPAQQHVLSVLDAASQGAQASHITKLVLPESQLHAALDDLQSFDAGGQRWALQSSSPSLLTYAQFYIERIIELTSNASYFDISLITAGWLGMYYTFINLFLQLRTLGSRTFLFLAAIISSVLAFMCAYAVTVMFGISVPKLALVQGLPFFVLVVGFNSKVRLAREALLNPEQLSAAEAVRRSVLTQIGSIARETVLEICVMIGVGLSTKIPALFEFSVMAVLVLLFDLVFLVTFYAALVSLKVAMIQVERNDAVRRALQDEGVSRDVATAYADEVLHSSSHARAAKFTHFRWVGGSVRLLLVFGFFAVNWVNIVHFPISFSMHTSDLAGVTVRDFAPQLPTPSVFTAIPPLRFAPQVRTFGLAQAWSVLRSVPGTLLVGLCLSLVCNAYLAGVVMRHSATPLLVTPRASPQPSKLSADTTTATKSRSTASTTAKPTVPSSTDVVLRSSEECEQILKSGGAPTLEHEELVALVLSGKLPLYALEKQLKDTTRAVVVRRAAVSRLSTTQTLEHSDLPYKDYNYDRVLGACCENVIGVMPLPLGVAGPVLIDGEEFYLPMATTEGVLVASTMRGCKALNAGGGVATEILADGMTRGPCVTFNRASRAAACKIFLDSDEGYTAMERAFNSTSRYARMTNLKTSQAGAFLYIRFQAQTGDAMGMNMISKGTERALQVLAEDCGFEDMTIVSVSGNYCTDKKAAAINWIEGRGKSVVAEAVVPGDKVRAILKTGVDELVELNMAKNLVGSSMAGALGGFNAHAANLVAAVFLATGQDPAQVVEGSNCMTLMSNVDGDLQISVTMPSLEVGTIGGGTILEPQAAMLSMLGVKGPHMTAPGENARKLARIVATAVLAGELSLNSALAAGHLVQSHMAHNRAKPQK